MIERLVGGLSIQRESIIDQTTCYLVFVFVKIQMAGSQITSTSFRLFEDSNLLAFGEKRKGTLLKVCVNVLICTFLLKALRLKYHYQFNKINYITLQTLSNPATT